MSWVLPGGEDLAEQALSLWLCPVDAEHHQPRETVRQDAEVSVLVAHLLDRLGVLRTNGFVELLSPLRPDPAGLRRSGRRCRSWFEGARDVPLTLFR